MVAAVSTAPPPPLAVTSSQQQQQQQQHRLSSASSSTPSATMTTASTTTTTTSTSNTANPTAAKTAIPAVDGSASASTPAPASASVPPASCRYSFRPSTSEQHASRSNLPLSARVSAPLDLSTVERRGQPNAVPDLVKHSRPFGLQEAPTFTPTVEEFKDPLEYIRKIAPEGKKYGICKIIPPESWNPPFAIDTERFHFRTRKQELNSVDGGAPPDPSLPLQPLPPSPSLALTNLAGTRANLNYLDQLQKFHKQHGMNLSRFPSVDKRPLDLYKLKKAVQIRGGFEKVCKQKKWAEIGRDLGYSGKIMSSLSTSLKNSYQRWLHPFEEYLRVAKPGVYQQLEHENGGPFTPSPKTSPVKKAHNNVNGAVADTSRMQSPVPHLASKPTTSLAQTPVSPMRTASPQTTADSTPKPSQLASTASQSQSATGFATVNASPNFVPLNGVKEENDHDHIEVAANGASQENSQEQSLKRSSNHDGTQSENGDSANGRRSKRLKHEGSVSTPGDSQSQRCGGSRQRSTSRPRSVARSRSKNGSRKTGDKCESCGTSERQATILMCDGCDGEYHMACLDPPLEAVPENEWFCPRCLVGTGEYGFEDGGVYSLKEFQEKASNFRREYLARRGIVPDDAANKKGIEEIENEVEMEFWKQLQNVEEPVEVEYGADIHCTTHGSAFPTLERQPLDPYSTVGWNLNVLPLYGESLFKHIKTDISGMTVPWAYVGMMFSAFCWHNEDHYAYSANYQHFGATKTWYGVPGEQTEAFEEAMRQHVPELFETQPDLLFQLVTLLPPDRLRKAGVDVYAIDQRAGQFVITFPRAYHGGFNHGFNFNEAVNFAPTDWEPMGQAGVDRLREFRRQPCFSHDELLITAAARDSSIHTAKWLGPALKRLADRELEQRRAFKTRQAELAGTQDGGGSQDVGKFVLLRTDLPEEEYMCHHCRAFCYCAHFRCDKSGRIMCLPHAESFECCDEDVAQKLLSETHTLRYRLSDDELTSAMQTVLDRASIPEAWTQKLDKVLSGNAKPPLKALQSLVSEGEKISYHLPGLQDLADYVVQCGKWVNEATNYITRKQQNRRKNEKAWRRSVGRASAAASAAAALQSPSQEEERDVRETRSLENLYALMKEAETLWFQCPQITALEEKIEEIEQWRKEAKSAISSPQSTSSEAVAIMVERGKNFCVAVPETEKLEEVLRQMHWNDEAKRKRQDYVYQSLDDCRDFIKKGESLGVQPDNEHMLYYRDLQAQGEAWEEKASQLLRMDVTHYQQLETLAQQAERIPVSQKTLSEVEAILVKQREAQRRVSGFLQATKELDYAKRPLYKDVRDFVESVSQLSSKPEGLTELSNEKKRHEDWMRKGKKLFGKGNAPLHILKMHMQYVEKKNSFCFDLDDRFRPPVEPPSREASPDAVFDAHSWVGGRSKNKDVFCLCRQQESGLMIECNICHEWYHGKCLKIARGKVKEDDDYTCPICDWRVKIPRDAARPKLEALQEWQAEIPELPFRPEEEEILKRIVDQGASFREWLRPLTNPACMTVEEVPTLVFYLRKIEGAEILLTYETNFFRQEIHKFAPVAPDPPPILEQSLSTRKPRPTKQQKMMARYGVDKPEDLPLDVRSKFQAANNKKKANEMRSSRPSQTPLQPAQDARQSRAPSADSRATSNHMQPPHPAISQVSSSMPSPATYAFPPAFSFHPHHEHAPEFSPHGPSAFLPHVSTSPALSSGQSPAAAAAHHPTFDPALFSPTHFAGEDSLRQSGLAKEDVAAAAATANAAEDDGHGPFGSSPRDNMDDIFADFTNQDDAEPGSGSMEEVEINQPNEAREALEALGDTRSNSRDQRMGSNFAEENEAL